MSMPGMGVLINQLFGNRSKADADAFIQSRVGKKLTAVRLDVGPEAHCRADYRLYLEVEGDLALALYDDGQSCCEARYMTTDDDLPSFVGATLLGIESRPGPEAEDQDYGAGGLDAVHEQMFVKVITDAGDITLCTHVEHNGYYGGFSLTIEDPKAGRGCQSEDA